MTAAPAAARRRVRLAGTVAVALAYGAIALAVNVPEAGDGFFSDEATYYLMGRSLALDGDLEYRQEDIERARQEFPRGPSGVFLKRGVSTDVTGLSRTFPFVKLTVLPDADPGRLYYGKSFAYPLAASPFVYLFGTNGFLVFNALLMAASFWMAFTVLAGISGTRNGLLLAAGFIFATVVPVYAVWITPELFNCTLGMLAYYLWLGRFAPGPAEAGPSDRSSDLSNARLVEGRASARPDRPPATPPAIAAAAVIGIATFSKVTNVLLLAPVVAWQLWQRQWRAAVRSVAACSFVTALLFSANVYSSGDWNYQGSALPDGRQTCYENYPFEREGAGLEVCEERGRNEVLTGVIFDPEVFWTNLAANVGYFVFGRNSGLALYYFPVLFGVLAMVWLGTRGEAWRWFVLGGVLLQAGLFIVSLPYTYFGGGGSVGNRYFMGVYGICLFLFPAVRSAVAAAVPLVVGSVFMAGLVLSPFDTSVRPYQHAKSSLFKVFPVELTNVNDLPVMNQRERVRIWYGDNPALGHPGFQIYYLDDNSYLQEADKRSLWVRGESRAEWLVKTERPVRRLRLLLRAGPVETTVTVTADGRRQQVDLGAGASGELVLDLPVGFPYKNDRVEPAWVWVVSVESSAGFHPRDFEPESPDVRFLGVLVTPYVIP